uniref:Uncharacterized protein n=1 Tax=Anolis carolinensis TaxID=28377 RepID=G1KW17_ANOCA
QPQVSSPVGKDLAVMRKQRIQVVVELCKAILNFSPEIDEKNVVFKLSLEEITEVIKLDNPYFQLKAAQTVSKLLPRPQNPPTNSVIESGIIPKLMDFLYHHDTPALQLQTAWVLTNIALGMSDQIRAVVEVNSILGLVVLLSSPHLYICEQAVWALGNIADDDSMYRDTLIIFNVIPLLLTLVAPTTPIGFLRNFRWTLSKLYGSNDHIQVVMQAGILPRLIQLMTDSEMPFCSLALHAMGNITTGTDEQIQMAIDASMLSVLPHLIHHPKLTIQKKAAYTSSNIAVGSGRQLQQIITCRSLPPLVEPFPADPEKSRLLQFFLTCVLLLNFFGILTTLLLAWLDGNWLMHHHTCPLLLWVDLISKSLKQREARWEVRKQNVSTRIYTHFGFSVNGTSEDTKYPHISCKYKTECCST